MQVVVYWLDVATVIAVQVPCSVCVQLSGKVFLSCGIMALCIVIGCFKHSSRDIHVYFTQYQKLLLARGSRQNN